MKYCVSILFLIVASQIKVNAQKTCLDSLNYFDERADSFILELKQFVKGKDSAFVFYSSGLVDIFGILAYTINGKLYANEVIYDYKTIEVKQLDKEAVFLVKEFYDRKYFENVVTTNRYFGDDGGLEEKYIFLYNSQCWYLDNTYLLEENNNMSKWLYNINEFAWKRHDLIFERKIKERR